MWGFVGKCSCVKIWRRVLTLPVAMLSMRSLDSATVLYSNSYYTVVASIVLVSAASCKAICEVRSVRTSDYSQPFWLKWHALLMPHVLIKYAHVLICISAGEGSRHFSAFHNYYVNPFTLLIYFSLKKIKKQVSYGQLAECIKGKLISDLNKQRSIMSTSYEVVPCI